MKVIRVDEDNVYIKDFNAHNIYADRSYKEFAKTQFILNIFMDIMFLQTDHM